MTRSVQRMGRGTHHINDAGEKVYDQAFSYAEDPNTGTAKVFRKPKKEPIQSPGPSIKAAQPPTSAEDKAQSGLGAWIRGVASNVGEGIGRADDAVQGVMRHDILRLPTDGSAPGQNSFLGRTRENLGVGLFPSRAGADVASSQYKVKEDERATLFATRAAQAGLTAAGVGLAKLTLDMAGQFGGPADSPAPSELSP